VATAVAAGLVGETAGEEAVVDEATIETETMVEGMIGNLGEAMGEILTGVAQDTRGLPQDVEVIPETEGQLDGRLTPMCLVDEVDQDVTKGGGCQHPNLLYGQRLRDLLRGLAHHLREHGAAHCQGLHPLLLAGAGPYLVHQKGAVLIEVEEAEGEEGVRIVALAEGHHLLLIHLALHHLSVDEQRLTL